MKVLGGDFSYETMGEALTPMMPTVVEEGDILSSVETMAEAQIDKGVKLLQSTGVTQEAEKYGLKLTKERIMLIATAYVMYRMMKNKFVWLGLLGAGAFIMNQKKGDVIAPKAPVTSVDPSTRPLDNASQYAPEQAVELSGWI